MPFEDGPNTRITNLRWWLAAILEKSKNRHLGRGLTDRREIWHSHAFDLLTLLKLKIPTL